MKDCIEDDEEYGVKTYLDISVGLEDAAMPRLVWLSRLGVILPSKTSPVQFPTRAYAWVAGLGPCLGSMGEAAD